MTSTRERRANALEAIANALLELAAVEREPKEEPPSEVLIDRRNCQRELGLNPSTFRDAAGRDFPAFVVSKRITASKADVLAWLKSRSVRAKPPRSKPPANAVQDPDRFFREVQVRFEKRVGRPMTDDELYQADVQIDAGRSIAAHYNEAYTETPDDVAGAVASKIGKEPRRHGEWRSLGLDVADMEKRAEELRAKLRAENPEMTWNGRVDAVFQMWGTITEPLEEARRAARKAAREAKKAAKGNLGEGGQSGSKR